MIITKKEIIEAINKEPLGPGYFYFKGEDGKCTVCAVGAVLRNKGVPDPKRCDYRGGFTKAGYALVGSRYSAGDSLLGARISGNWFSVLSVKFEKLCEKVAEFDTPLTPQQQERVRKELTAYVKKYFPEQIEAPLEKYL